MNCASCVFSEAQFVDFNADGMETPTPVLLCHRFPPVLVPAGNFDEESRTTEAGMAFPQVQGDDWCGEWRGVKS